MDTIAILLSSFILSLVALLTFIFTQRGGAATVSQDSANVIFADGEIGVVEDAAASPSKRVALQLEADNSSGRRPTIEASDPALIARAAADAAVAPVVFIFYCCAFAWLLVASTAGFIASLKLHNPDFLTSSAWLTFGRVRTIHLNAVAYGWAPMAGLGTALFIIPRLLHTPLAGARYAVLGCMLWNAGLIAGIGSIGYGVSDGLEWLEIPWQIDILFVLGGALIGVPLVNTLLATKVKHLYVSVWYMACALFWFPTLLIVSKIPYLHRGVEQAVTNWWYGHNVLGLFYTPLALASIYYFLPKVIGRPIQSYNLSLLGFWTLAFFYAQVGGHHLIGGPIPAWLVTLSIVQSVMMIIPVVAFTVNQALTLQGRLSALRYSPTLRFIGMGGIFYMLSSLQGSLEALRSVNRVTHFTHFTVAHAHLGLYGFVTFVFFGSMYFVIPRITQREWPSPGLIALHFWLDMVGITIYFTSLTIGGWLQGMAMLDGTRPFIDSVKLTIPYLEWRSVGGGLMVLGHLTFALHFLWLLLVRGSQTNRAARLEFA